MNVKYQLIILGQENEFIIKVIESLYLHIRELGLLDESIAMLYEDDVKHFRGNAPAVCLYYSNVLSDFKNVDDVIKLLNAGVCVLPITDDKSRFTDFFPEELYPINGFELKSDFEIEALVSKILEGLSLLRLSRRLFISYRRNESRSTAIQLYEQLEAAGFDVFLDTHSIRPGELFQEELWHRLMDTDVVVLLNTPDFLGSTWTKQELAKANSLSIGILQLIWPKYTPERETELSIPYRLNENDFVDGKYNDKASTLIESTLIDIVSKTESLRARSLAARQDNIISEFISTANFLGIKAHLQPEKFITIKKSNGNEIVVIPTIGVPHAFTYNQSEELIKLIKSHDVEKVYLLYDHRNIREKWLSHLSWLDNYLPISSIKIVEIHNWLENLKI